MRQLIGLEAAASTQSQACTAGLGVADGLVAAVGEDVGVGVAVIRAVAVKTRVDVKLGVGSAVAGDPDGLGLGKPEVVAVAVGEPANGGVAETIGEGW